LRAREAARRAQLTPPEQRSSDGRALVKLASPLSSQPRCHHHRRGLRQAGTWASTRPTRSARAATKKGAWPLRAAVVQDQPLRSGSRQAVGKPARPRSPDPTRSARAATKKGTWPLRAAVVQDQPLRSGGRQAVGKPARRHPPDRRARRAPLRRREHDHCAPPWCKTSLFVAAASSPPEGPSVSRHARVHPTDALGARRYEEEDEAGV